MSSSLRLPLIPLLLLGALACDAETFGEGDLAFEPGELQVVGGTAVAGAYLTLSAPWMAQMADTVSLAIDDRRPLLAVRADTSSPSRFLLSLPIDLPIGNHTVTLHRSSREWIPVGSFNTGGFIELRVVQTGIYAPAQTI